jgi:hypothetical protein
MKYVLPVILFLVIAGAPSARAELRIYGPFLYGQIEQARQAALMERELAKRQRHQAEQSALYAHVLEKGQKKQAELAGAYMLELGKGQKRQAELAAEYAKVLQARDTEWRNGRYRLRAEQEKEMIKRGYKMFDESLINAPVAVKETKKSDTGASLLDALHAIDNGADFR